MPGRPPSIFTEDNSTIAYNATSVVSSVINNLDPDKVSFVNTNDCLQTDVDVMIPVIPAKPSVKMSQLADTCVVLPENRIFLDKVLPSTNVRFELDPNFSTDYFVGLHNLVVSQGVDYPYGTPNYMGARVPLAHSRLKIQNWREYLRDYPHCEILQFLEYGFPLGLSKDPVLEPSLKNHSSAYLFFPFVDEFFSKGLSRNEICGPFRTPPFEWVHTSPLMTAPKKPDSRRAVFDATYGLYSLNNNTPKDYFLEMPCIYDYPSIDAFKDVVLDEGQGCFMWKRDLSRFYLQIPLDPVEYPRVACVWRGQFYFFVALMFGLTHSGLQGQKLSSAVTWIHKRMGLETEKHKQFNSLNYCDDIGGCEKTHQHATKSFDALGLLFSDLGLDEASAKATPPSTRMIYLGVEFDSVTMTMKVPPEKIQELREVLSSWLKKSKTNKRALQSLLGKLFWVSRCIRFSRGFMGRLLNQLRDLHKYPDYKNSIIPNSCKEDIAWWARYLRRFNGTELIYPLSVSHASVEELINMGAVVNCGDAQPLGGGAFFGDEYWSTPFPTWLQDTDIPIHVKEFWVVIVSAALWGELWRGQIVYIFSDNAAVVNVLDRERPRDPALQNLLREFMYLVCTRSFTPIIRHVGTEQNKIADFLSRNHNESELRPFLGEHHPVLKTRRSVPNAFFKLNAVW